MSFRERFAESRRRYLDAYNVDEASKYDAWVTALQAADHEACLQDIASSFSFATGMNVLDVGAGTGALCLALVRFSGLRITALEPCPAMLDRLGSKPELNQVATVEGFCDHPDDRSLFPAKQFDVIVSRQVANCLFDPIAAFQNWHHWLRDQGTVIVIDGLFDRSDWTGVWAEMVDSLPLSTCRSMATVPYLLEQTGYSIEFVGAMNQTNARPSTRTSRYMVLAKKSPGEGP